MSWSASALFSSTYSPQSIIIYSGPVAIYHHEIFESPHEFSALMFADGTRKLILPSRGEEAAVFEGFQPISWAEKGKTYVIATESLLTRGSRLAFYQWSEELGWVALDRTEPIGKAHRWLALSWFGDLDADGHFEVGYVQTPHLNGILKLYEIENNHFEFRGELRGFSNHKLGSDQLLGGRVVCDGSLTWLLPDSAFQNWMKITFTGGKLGAQAYAPFGAWPKNCIQTD